MNILFLSHRVPFPPNKGEKIRTFHQLKHLKEQGHKIYLVAPFEDEAEQGYFDALERQYCKQVLSYKLPAKWLRFSKGLLKNQALSVANFYDAGLQRALAQFLSEHKIDALICTASSMAPYVFALEKRLQGVDCFMDFMDLDSDKWQQYQASAGFPMSLVYKREARKMARLEAEVQRRFKACFFISQNEVDLFTRFPDLKQPVNNVLVMGNGLDTKSFYPASSKRVDNELVEPHFLFTGVMDYPPNEDAVIWFCEQVWQQILAQWPDARFTIAGMNPSPEVKALERLKGVEVTGFVEDILPYYHQADVFVAPFRLARGVQNKVLQAFACGIPVVTTAMGTEGIACENGKHYLEANSPDETFAQIRKLLGSAALRGSIAKDALSLIEDKYSWQGMLSVLDDCLADSTQENAA